jgi:hypothetical protein
MHPRLTFVKLTKVMATEAPLSSPWRWGEYRLGSPANTTSLSVDYTMVGILLNGITIGESVRLLRVERNEVPILGEFESTPAVRLTDDGFATANSVYRLEILDPQYTRIELRACDRGYDVVFTTVKPLPQK